MRIRARAHWLPKAGNRCEDYEDACWPEGQLDRAVGRFRCAVADGATETSFSRLWAQLLVHAWGRGHLGRRDFIARIPVLRRQWLAEVTTRPLPWYAEEKRQRGAFAAVVGLYLADARRGGSNAWHALAVGDACAFQLREGELMASFPLTQADQFGIRPWLLSTKCEQNDDAVDHIRTVSGSWRTGDTFYLMTDALACWFLSASGSTTDLDMVAAHHDPHASTTFSAWICGLRDAGRLRNDDVTLLRVEVE